MGSEKRQFPRIDLVFDFKYEPISNGASPQKTSPKDISAGGVSFRIASPVSQDTTLRVHISFPEIDGEIIADARVVRTWEEDGSRFAAVSFTTIDESDHMIIDEYIHYSEEGAFT